MKYIFLFSLFLNICYSQYDTEKRVKYFHLFNESYKVNDFKTANKYGKLYLNHLEDTLNDQKKKSILLALLVKLKLYI